MYKVLVADPMSELGLRQLLLADDIEVDQSTGLSEEELVSIIASYDALLVRSQTRVTRRILEAATRLKVIGRAGVGVDNIDLEAATQQGILVTNAPDGNTVTACEHTWAMMMALARHIPQAYATTVSGRWDRKAFLGVELRHKVLGVLGLGRIGREVAARGAAFGMKVIGYDPFYTPEEAEQSGVTLASLEEMWQTADFLTVHTPLTSDTYHLIGRPQFERMKRGIRIINCARGGIIDETALLDALDEGIVAGAAFDVLEQEPPPAEHRLLSHPRVIVTPHLGASTVEAQEHVALEVSEQIMRVLRDQPFDHAVNMPVLHAELSRRLQPYYRLCEQLGSSIAQMTDGTVSELTVSCSGELAELDTAPLLPYALKGVLSRTEECAERRVNAVNALQVAKELAIKLHTGETQTSEYAFSTVTIRLKTDLEERWVSGAYAPDTGSRIVRIGPYPVEIPPEGQLLLISQQDKPGIIGRVGVLLGEAGLNIATMQVGRQEIGGSAVMILRIDQRASAEVLASLLAMPDIKRVRQVDFV